MKAKNTSPPQAELTEALSQAMRGVGKIARDAAEAEAEAEDAVQEAMVELLEAYDLGVVIESLGAWVSRVARNKLLDRFRRRRTRRDHEARELAQEAPVSADRPDTEWTRTWLRAEIVDALTQLPPEQAEVFVLHELEGRSFEEISALTGQNLNTLLSRKRYAVLSLRQYLKEVYDELE